MTRRRKRIEPEENLDRWLVSYADFITLLFAFFVVMYAVSSVNEGKYEQLSTSLNAVFQTEPKSLDPIQVGDVSRSKKTSVIDTPMDSESAGEASSAPQNFKALGDQIEQEILMTLQSDKLTLRRSEDWLEVEMNSNILFSSGQVQLVNSSKPILRKLAVILAGYPNPINVEGFTDDIPINTDVFRSNWELSAARAATVVHLFTKTGVEPSRMSAIGYGQFRPIVENNSEINRIKNRRVVIAILANDMNVRKLAKESKPRVE